MNQSSSWVEDKLCQALRYTDRTNPKAEIFLNEGAIDVKLEEIGKALPYGQILELC